MAASAQIATLVCTVPDLDAAAAPQVGTQHSVAGTLHWEAQLCMAVDASDRTDSESHSRTEGLGTASAADGCSCTAQTRRAEPAAAAVVEVGRSHIRTAAAGTVARACTAVEAREDRRRGGGNRWQRAQC